MLSQVLVVNSTGAYCRLQARAMGESLQRERPQPLDAVFEAQVEMALQ